MHVRACCARAAHMGRGCTVRGGLSGGRCRVHGAAQAARMQAQVGSKPQGAPRSTAALSRAPAPRARARWARTQHHTPYTRCHRPPASPMPGAVASSARLSSLETMQLAKPSAGSSASGSPARASVIVESAANLPLGVGGGRAARVGRVRAPPSSVLLQCCAHAHTKVVLSSPCCVSASARRHWPRADLPLWLVAASSQARSAQTAPCASG